MIYHQPPDRQQTAGRKRNSARSFGSAMGQEPGPQGAYAGEGVIQAKTMIHYSPGRYDYDFNPLTGKYNKSVTVGREMHAKLDPDDPKNGSSTSSGGDVHRDLTGYLNKKWGIRPIRGHLLNDHLGGLSVEENLFPISHEANSQHLHQVEGYVKTLAYDRGSNRPGMVGYDVSVMNEDGSQQFDEFHPRTVFDCHVIVYGREEADSAREDRATILETEYVVRSDISDGSTEHDKSDFAGYNIPYSNNASTRWNPGNTKLEERQGDNGNGYELRRQSQPGSSVGQDSLGTVTYESGSYLASELPGDYEDWDNKWGHCAEVLYAALSGELEENAGQILEYRQDGMYQKAEELVAEKLKSRIGEVSGIVSNLLFQNPGRKSQETINAEIKKVVGELWDSDKNSAVFTGVCSLYVRYLQEQESNAMGTKAEDMFAANQAQMVDIIIRCDGEEARSKEVLLEIWGRNIDASAERYLEVFYRKGMQTISDTVRKELQAKVIPRIWQKKDTDWISYVSDIVFRVGETNQQKELEKVTEEYILEGFKDNDFRENIPFICGIAEKGSESNLYKVILNAGIGSTLEAAISRMQRMILSRLRATGLSDEADSVVWQVIGEDAELSMIVEGLRQGIDISSCKDECFEEAYAALENETNENSGEWKDNKASDDIIGKFYEEIVRNKYKTLQNLFCRIFYDCLTPLIKGKILALFGSSNLTINAVTEMIMAQLGVGEGCRLDAIPGCTEEVVRQCVDKTPTDYDWLDLSRKFDPVSERKAYEKEHLIRIMLNWEFNFPDIKAIIHNVVYRWVFESDLEEEGSEENDPAYEE